MTINGSTSSPTADKDGIASTSQNQSSLTLTAGATVNDHDFSYTGTGGITDTVFFDIDDDATEEVGSDDRGLPAVDVTLAIDINGDGVTDYTTASGCGTAINRRFGPFTTSPSSINSAIAVLTGEKLTL